MHEVGLSRESIAPNVRADAALPRVERFDAGAVPGFWIETPLPYAAGLIFRVGRADETLATSGLSHLVEHLALFGVGEVGDVEANGYVTAIDTHFYARGARERVVASLTNVASALRELPLARLAAEKRVLEVERQQFGGVVQWLMATRFGASGYGLLGWPEYGLSRISPDDLTRWASERFTRENAALWVAGPSPLRLDVDLATGDRIPPPTATAPIASLLPAWVSGGGGLLGVALLRSRTAAARLAMTILAARLRQKLRVDLGSSYSVQEIDFPLTSDVAHTVILADVLDSAVSPAATSFIDFLLEFGTAPIDDDELARVRFQVEQAMIDPASRASLAVSAAAGELLGEREWSPSSLLAEVNACNAQAVTAAFQSAFRTALVFVPDDEPTGRLPLLQPINSPPVRGRKYRPQPLVSYLKGARLTLGDEGVSLTDRNGRSATVRFDDCAALIRSVDGNRLLVGNDGQAVGIGWLEYRRGTKLIREIERRTPADLILDVDSDERAGAVEDAVESHLERRWVVHEEVARLPEHLEPDERIVVLAEAVRRLRAGLLAVTDRRLLFLTSAFSQKVKLAIDLRRDRIERVRGFQSVFGGRLTVRADGKSYRFTEVEPRARLREITALLARAEPSELDP